MAWYITDGVLQKADTAPAANSILTDITGIGDVIIPGGVTSIGKGAFRQCSSLTSITLPDGLTSIEDSAFYKCPRLKSISLPDGLTSIGIWAFCDCSSLKSINLPDGLTNIRQEAFKGCSSLKSLTLPYGLTSIGEEAFKGCSSLTSLTLPDGLTGIGDGAFDRCSRLKSLTIRNSVTDITWCKFKDFPKVTTLSAPGHILGELDKKIRSNLKEIRCTANVGKVPPALRALVFTTFSKHEQEYSEELRAEHIAAMKKSAAKLTEAACACPELLHILCREKLISAKDIDAFTEEATRQSSTEATAVLLNYQASVLTMQTVSKARAKKEQVREQQDEIVMDRMMTRVDHVGIDGLNFVVTGKLNQFAKREDIKAYITERGGKLLSAMSANADYLITNDTDTGSAKNIKAAELGIVILTEDEFLKMAAGTLQQ